VLEGIIAVGGKIKNNGSKAREVCET